MSESNKGSILSVLDAAIRHAFRLPSDRNRLRRNERAACGVKVEPCRVLRWIPRPSVAAASPFHGVFCWDSYLTRLHLHQHMKVLHCRIAWRLRPCGSGLFSASRSSLRILSALTSRLKRQGFEFWTKFECYRVFIHGTQPTQRSAAVAGQQTPRIRLTPRHLVSLCARMIDIRVDGFIVVITPHYIVLLNIWQQLAR